MSGDISLEEAAFTEPQACGIHSVKRSGIEFGDNVVIVGCGIMGQLHSLLCRLKGARVIVVEPRQDRRDLATVDIVWSGQFYCAEYKISCFKKLP